MRTTRLRTWSAFKQRILEDYVRLAVDKRNMFCFRGHGDARWPLRSTLDRVKEFDSDSERLLYSNIVLHQFRQELIGLQGPKQIPEGKSLELLARHHGLPSPLLDWTESPYIAAFFAFQDAIDAKSKKVGIWALNRRRIDEAAGIEFIDDRELLRFSPRALEQNSIFIRVQTCEIRLEELLGAALTRYELPAREFAIALTDLKSMNITARNLFRDADAAARTAKSSMHL